MSTSIFIPETPPPTISSTPKSSNVGRRINSINYPRDKQFSRGGKRINPNKTKALDNLHRCPVCKQGLADDSGLSMKQNYQRYKRDAEFFRRKLEADWEGKSAKRTDEDMVVVATCGELFHKKCLTKFCSTATKSGNRMTMKKLTECPRCNKHLMFSHNQEIDLDGHRLKASGPTKFDKDFNLTRVMNQELLFQHEKEASALRRLQGTVEAAKIKLEAARVKQGLLVGMLPPSGTYMEEEVAKIRQRKEEKASMEKYIEKAQQVIEFMQKETPNTMRMYLKEVQTGPLDEIPKHTSIPRMLIPYLHDISEDDYCLFALSQIVHPRPYPGTRFDFDDLLLGILRKVNPSLCKNLESQAKKSGTSILITYDEMFPDICLKMLKSCRDTRKSKERDRRISQIGNLSGHVRNDLAITIMYMVDEEGDHKDEQVPHVRLPMAQYLVAEKASNCQFSSSSTSTIVRAEAEPVASVPIPIPTEVIEAEKVADICPSEATISPTVDLPPPCTEGSGSGIVINDSPILLQHNEKPERERTLESVSEFNFEAESSRLEDLEGPLVSDVVVLLNETLSAEALSSERLVSVSAGELQLGSKSCTTNDKNDEDPNGNFLPECLTPNTKVDDRPGTINNCNSTLTYIVGCTEVMKTESVLSSIPPPPPPPRPSLDLDNFDPHNNRLYNDNNLDSEKLNEENEGDPEERLESPPKYRIECETALIPFIRNQPSVSGNSQSSSSWTDALDYDTDHKHVIELQRAISELCLTVNPPMRRRSKHSGGLVHALNSGELLMSERESIMSRLTEEPSNCSTYSSSGNASLQKALKSSSVDTKCGNEKMLHRKDFIQENIQAVRRCKTSVTNQKVLTCKYKSSGRMEKGSFSDSHVNTFSDADNKNDDY